MNNISLDIENIKQGEISKNKLALISLSIGFLVVFLVGLSQPVTFHNAAHDVRHSVAFPCH